jgi:2-polyprenyl-3-methyl-5-hydroxy-6-metoxy-1,4-benzoquinol methylase
MYSENYFKNLQRQYQDPKSLMSKKLTLVKKYCVGGRLLDFGCGTGDFIEVVRDDFKEIVGIDISHHAVQLCRRKFYNSKNIIIVHGSHEDLEKLGYFDCITALDVLEHLEYPYALTAVRKFFSITKTGGRLIITTPNWYDKIFRILDKNRLHKHAHSSVGWRKMVSNIGYKPLFTRTVDFPLLHSETLCINIHLFGTCALNVFEKPVE